LKYPQDFIDRVREATNIVDLIRQHVELRQSGGDLHGLCPFHHEKTPSFSVSETKQVYHCFGCKASGNAYTFCQNHQGMTFRESVEYLARRAGIPLPELVNRSGTDFARDLRSTMYKINGLAAQFYHQALKGLSESHPARQYLVERGLNKELIDSFKIGYAPDAWSDLAEDFVLKRVPVAPAEQLGLIKRRTGDQSGHYDLFRNRIMFPTFSPTGQCLGFGGRVLSQEQQPKYLNSPESPVYHKGRIFYGLQHSAKYLRSQDEAIVVEGYMDWLALAKASVNNVIAVNGTAMTADHARLIKRYTNRVLILFDGDAAGKNAARRCLPVLLSEGLLARGLFLPNELDPDEFIRVRGETALRDLLRGAPDLFDLVAGDEWSRAKSSPSAKIQFLDEMAPLLAATADIRLRRLYGQNVAALADVPLSLVERSVVALLKSSSAKEGRKPSSTHSGIASAFATATATATAIESPEAPVTFELSGAPRPEIELLNVILLKDVYLKEAMAAGIVDYFTHPGAKAVFQKCVEVYRQMPNKFDNLSALLAGEVKPVETITRHLSEQYTSMSGEAVHRMLQDCMKSVKKFYWKAQTKELLSDLRGQGAEISREKLEQIMNIQKDRTSLSLESKNSPGDEE
jgi:DNA primase